VSDPWGGVGGWSDPRYTWTPNPNIDPYHWPPGTDTAQAAMAQPGAPAAAPAAPAVSSVPALAPGQQDAFDALRGTLHLFGLDDPEMVAWVKQQIIDGTGQSSIMLALYDPATVPGKVVDRMYPEIRGRREANLAPISIQDAVGYRDNAIQLMHAAGLPPEFYDQPEDLARFQIRDVSLVELKSRIDEAAMASTQAPPETRAQLQSLYGVDSGHLTAYYLDPDKAQPVLQKQFAAATLSGTGVRSGYGALDRSQAERLATLGVSSDQAAQGFGQLVQSKELFGALPGEAGIGVLSRDEQLAAAFGGDAAAQEKIRRTAAARKAMFGEGGGFAAGQKGLAGLGSAATT
jgi:hypothetical protein